MSYLQGKTISPISASSQLLNSIATIMIVAAVAAAQSLPLAGPRRPATVPADYVITPFGYFHPSCVMHLAKGDVEQEDESAVQHADGSYESVPPCAYTRYDSAGNAVADDERSPKEPTISHNWIEYGSTTTTSSFGELYAY